MKKTSLIFITLIFLLTSVVACGGQPSAPSGGGSSGSSGGSSGGSGLPTSAPARATSAPAQPTNAPAQTADDFAAALTRAFREGDTGYLRSVMEDPFWTGHVMSEYGPSPNMDEAMFGIEHWGMFEGSISCYQDRDQVLSLFFGSDDFITGVSGTDYQFYCEGYGEDGLSEAVLMVNGDGHGGFTWKGVVFAVGGMPDM